MINFNVNNSDFYYTGATGSFNNFCNNHPEGPSYLYVTGHDDEYSFTEVIGPWPYLNTGLLPVRPPTGIFSGSGQCIGCPKIASDSQYLEHRLFNTRYLPSEWESIYPTFDPNIVSRIPYLQTGLNVSWFKPNVYMEGRMAVLNPYTDAIANFQPFKYFGPQLDVIGATADQAGGDTIPFWDTNGAKIHVKYAIKGKNYARLVVGFTMVKVFNQDIETNTDFDGYDYEWLQYENDLDRIINAYTYSLYYGYKNFNTHFSLDDAMFFPMNVFIFDSCAVRNVSNELIVYGPAPGFHIRGKATNLYSDNSDGAMHDNIHVRYFAFVKKEGNDNIDPRQKIRATISVAGFGHPKGLLGLYYNEKQFLNYGKPPQEYGPYRLHDYSLNWGRGINVSSGDLNYLNQSKYLSNPKKIGLVYDFVKYFEGVTETSGPYSGLYNAYAHSYGFPDQDSADLIALKLNTRTGCKWVESTDLEFSALGINRLCGVTAFTNENFYKNNNPKPCFAPRMGRRNGYTSKGVYALGNTVVLKEAQHRESPIGGALGYTTANIDSYGMGAFGLNLPYTPHSYLYRFSTQEEATNNFQAILFDYPLIDTTIHEHPLFYIDGKQIFATEPNFTATVSNLVDYDQNYYAGRIACDRAGILVDHDQSYYYCILTTGKNPGGFIHPYKKMVDYLDDFGIKTGIQKFIDPNNCIPKYILTTPVSENINYYSGYVTTEISNSGIISISGDNSIIVRSLGNTSLDMYNIINNYKILNPIIISDTGLFREDIDYIYPSNPNGLQGSPSKIIYDSGTNLVYNLAPFFGYYKYNLDTKCTTYNLSLNDGAYGDGGYEDLIVTDNRIYLLNTFKNKIYVINKLTENLNAIITGVESPVSMILDSGNRLYVGSTSQNYISIFDNKNFTQPYALTGVINFYENEYPIKMEILNDKLYTLTSTVSIYNDIVIISGINSRTGVYNTYSNTGYTRLRAQKPYSISKIVETNSIYIGSDSGIQIINADTDRWLDNSITGFVSNIEVPDRFSTFIPSPYVLRSDAMIFNNYDNKIYSIGSDLPLVFVLNTGTKKCEKIIDLSYAISYAGGINFDNNNKKIYISTSDRLNYGLLNNFVILGNRPKAQINFPSAPQLVNGNTYNLNITSNNNQTGILYKADNYPYILIDSSGDIILPTGAGVNNLEFKVFAGQMPTTGFAYSFDARVYKIGSTGTTSALSYNTGIGNYNPYVPPAQQSFLQSVRPNGLRMSGTMSCDFDDNQKIIALMSTPSLSESANSSILKIFNFNNYDLLQTYTGYNSDVQMNGSGSLIAVSLYPQQSNGSTLISIFTGVPTITGSYKLKQIITGLTGYQSPYILNRSGDILFGRNSNGSGVIYTGSLSSDWSIHSYISGSGISDFILSNDGSVIIGCKHLLGYTDELAVFTGSKNNGWKFKNSLSVNGVRIAYGSNSFYIKNEDIIIFKEYQNYSVAPLTPIHIFTGSKNNGWNFKQTIIPSDPIDNMNISDDGKLIVLISNDYYNHTKTQNKIFSFTGSKDLGWTQRDWMYIDGRYADKLMISHKNYLATFNYSPNYTNIWTYSGV